MHAELVHELCGGGGRGVFLRHYGAEQGEHGEGEDEEVEEREVDVVAPPLGLFALDVLCVVEEGGIFEVALRVGWRRGGVVVFLHVAVMELDDESKKD